MKSIKITVLLVIAFLFTPTAAIAADIPLLNWERGRQQQVVIAEGDLDRNWVVVLEGNGQESIPFIGSTKDKNGYVVFSVTIPDDLELGTYSIAATQNGGEKRIIAGVLLLPATTRTAASNLVDLTWIVIVFILLTAITSTIRARKYLFIPFTSTQVLPRITDPILETDENFWDRLETAPYRLRVNWLNSFKPSLLRFLLIREGEVSHRLNKNLYGLFPLIGLIAGVIASIQVSKNGGLALTATSLFIAVAVIGIADAFAGMTATLGFWSIQVFTGNVTSFRDILISFAIGISWVGPPLIAGILRETLDRDFSIKTERIQDPLRVVSVIGSSAIGALVFYFGQLLLQSIIYVEHPQLQVNALHVALIGFAILIRGFTDAIVVHSGRKQDGRDESFVISRVTSPFAALAIAFTVLGFSYIWTASFTKSFFVAVLFTVPYVFSFIRFGKNERINFEKIRRSILIESAVLGAITFVIFRQISISPLLLEKRVELMLLLVGVAPALHALFSAFYASNEEKFSFEEKSEIM
jgi:hypothetical protein